MVMEVVHEDVGEGNMQCTNHPFKNSPPGGICAFCLQERLRKLVSSSYPAAVFPSSSSSPSPSFRSTFNGSATTSAAGSSGSSTFHLPHLVSSSAATQIRGNDCGYHTRKSRLPFVLTYKKNKKKDEGSTDSATIFFKRSKSTATPGRGIHFSNKNYSEDYSPSRRGIWSFLYLSKQFTPKKSDKQNSEPFNSASSVNGNGGDIKSKEKQRQELVVVDGNESPGESAIDRKVSRSRSVGCGSRSFSSDFLERISTGFGDCTLRRVESQREGKPRMHKNGGDKCGGIFSGFSSSNLITSSVEENGKSLGHLSHGRSKSWGWALASPMRRRQKFI